MQLTLDATRRTHHVASRSVIECEPGPAKTRRAPSRFCRDARSMVIYDYGTPLVATGVRLQDIAAPCVSSRKRDLDHTWQGVRLRKVVTQGYVTSGNVTFLTLRLGTWLQPPCKLRQCHLPDLAGTTQLKPGYTTSVISKFEVTGTPVATSARDGRGATTCTRSATLACTAG